MYKRVDLCASLFTVTRPHIVSWTTYGFYEKCCKFNVSWCSYVENLGEISANRSTIIQLVYKSLAENTEENQKLPEVQHT